ncbi:putative transposase [Leekyejoonella antrihumi]|uniref:Helix-turn-helix domain-containing protein n=1 Tax=Leekyejoonella antrihumi TaxID=1660198 RepID=A0A563DP66_9MICO|nr:helix-turn-helix domain-containing protein [Leekyejoonella antrihumi]TWP31995.1 helix-turn-helix domain-containing protein [Leekyejoonella antrihumi]
MSRVSQPVLPLLPAEARPIGPIAGLVTTGEGSVVFVAGQASFAFAAGDETARRLAAVQLVTTKIASQAAVAAAFGVAAVTVWRWQAEFAADGVSGLISAKKGPKGPSKLTGRLAARIRDLDEQGLTLAEISRQAGVSTATVRVALGRVNTSHTADTTCDETTPDDTEPEVADDESAFGDGLDDGGLDGGDDQLGQGQLVLPVLPAPIPRTGERRLARTGLLTEAPVVFTPGAHLPLAGLLLVLPALELTGLLAAFESVFGRLRNGFYGLRSLLLTMVFLALLRDPRAEGATRIRPADLGRLLGLDRAPEVKTIRRKLSELAAYRRGADVQAALAIAHAHARPDALGFLHIDGHTRVYTGKRDLPKMHVGRLHMATHATAETWVADADADPILVLTGKPGASLVGELVRSIPDLRSFLGPHRRATVIFDRGGWSPACFQTLIDAGLHVLTYRKAPYDQLPANAFRTITWTDPEGKKRRYRLADQVVDLALDGGGTLRMRQVTKQTEDGTQIPILTSNTRLAASAVVWRMAGRWRQEGYFKYARTHFDLDVLDCYTDQPDDTARMVPNPAKKTARNTVARARTSLAAANAGLAAAIDDAVAEAGRPGHHGTAVVNPKPGQDVSAATDRLADAVAASRATPTHVPLGQVRPGARLLDEETKLLTHAIRMSAYNAETTLARMIAPYYARAEDEARALLREAFTLPGDIYIADDRLHVDLDPATAPRRSRALAALCEELTATETTYPGTNLTIVYTVKDHPDPS